MTRRHKIATDVTQPSCPSSSPPTASPLSVSQIRTMPSVPPDEICDALALKAKKLNLPSCDLVGTHTSIPLSAPQMCTVPLWPPNTTWEPSALIAEDFTAMRCPSSGIPTAAPFNASQTQTVTSLLPVTMRDPSVLTAPGFTVPRCPSNDCTRSAVAVLSVPSNPTQTAITTWRLLGIFTTLLTFIPTRDDEIIWPARVSSFSARHSSRVRVVLRRRLNFAVELVSARVGHATRRYQWKPW
jgi:hypothetical protein